MNKVKYIGFITVLTLMSLAIFWRLFNPPMGFLDASAVNTPTNSPSVMPTDIPVTESQVLPTLKPVVPTVQPTQTPQVPTSSYTYTPPAYITCVVPSCLGGSSTYQVDEATCNNYKQQAGNCPTYVPLNTVAPTQSQQSTNQATHDAQCMSIYQAAIVSSLQYSQGAAEAMKQVAESNLHSCLGR